MAIYIGDTQVAAAYVGERQISTAYIDALSVTVTAGGGGSEWLIELDFENGVYTSAADGAQSIDFFIDQAPVDGRLTLVAVATQKIIDVVSQPHTLVVDYDASSAGGSNQIIIWTQSDGNKHNDIYQDSGQGEIYSVDGVDYYSGSVIVGRNKIAATINGLAVSNSTNGHAAVGGTNVTSVAVDQFIIRGNAARAIRSLRIKGVDTDLPTLSAP